MSSKRILCTVGLLSVFFWGCVAQHPTIVKYEKDDGSRMATAPQDGTYGLWGQDDTAPEVKYDLASGDRIGFQENADGSVNAIAGNNMQTLKKKVLTRRYSWKLETPVSNSKSAAKSTPNSKPDSGY